MKTILILLLTVGSVFGGVTSILVEPMPVDNPVSFRVTAYGLLSEGRPKVFEYKELADMAKMSGVENCAQFDLNRRTIRYWIYFKENGQIDRTDFHMETPFESKIFSDTFDSQVETKVSTLKDHVETKSDDNEVKPTPIPVKPGN